MLADPGNRARAPEPLRVVQAFVNTRDIENDVDELSTRGAPRGDRRPGWRSSAPPRPTSRSQSRRGRPFGHWHSQTAASRSLHGRSTSSIVSQRRHS